MFDFVNAINRGYEPRSGVHGMFLLARGDEAKPVDGLPALPDRYLSAIRSQSLDAGVTSIESLPDYRSEGYCEKRYRLTLDHGAADGLVPGVELKVKTPANEYADLKISSAEAGNAVGEIAIYERDCKRPKSVPDRRWTFTTGHYDPAAANAQIRQAGARRSQ